MKIFLESRIDEKLKLEILKDLREWAPFLRDDVELRIESHQEEIILRPTKGFEVLYLPRTTERSPMINFENGVIDFKYKERNYSIRIPKEYINLPSK